MAFSDLTGPVADSSATSRIAEGCRRTRLHQLVEQHPLFETAPSRHALEDGGGALHAKTVFAGIGVVSGSMVSRGLPLDVMGLLLSAEQARRTLNAERLIVLVADSHGRSNGAPRELLDRQSAHYVSRLRGIADACGFAHMQVALASDWERDSAYRLTFEAVRRKVPSDLDPYVLREVADIAHVEREHGGVVKVGWALQRSRQHVSRDERTFDETFARWVGGRACFLYSKPGRALDDRRQKVSPYVVADTARRILIDPSEDVAEKLARAREDVSRSTYRGVCNHLKAVTRSYCKLVRRLDGALPQRAQAMIDDALAAPVRLESARASTGCGPADRRS